MALQVLRNVSLRVCFGIPLLIGLVLLLMYSSTDVLTTSLSGKEGQFRVPPPSAMPTCDPVNHIMFLKTHKCASSSMQNMFIRYGIMNNLTFALPLAGNYLGSPDLFKASTMPTKYLPQEGVVDIFALHTRLNPEEHRKILHPDAVFVTVVRDPVTLFESLFNYFHLTNIYGGYPLQRYLDLPLEKQVELRSKHNRFGYNMMLFDMGFDIHGNMTTLEVLRAIDQMDQLFDIVLLAEEMEESLILLKERLCWEYSDIIFFTKNARREALKPTITEKYKYKIRELNSADVLLYEHFAAKHKMAVLQYGSNKMADEVAHLRAMREEFFEDCGARIVDGFGANKLFKEYSSLVSAYVLEKNSDINCLILSLPELRLIDRLRESYTNRSLTKT